MMMVPTIFTKDIKEYCEEVKDKIRTSVREDFINEGAAVPILAVIQVGNNEASNRYIRNKKKDCESVGIKFEWYYYEESITQEQLIEEIKAKNRAILNLFLNSMLNAKVKKDAMNVINKIIKANIFNSPVILVYNNHFTI